MIKNYSEWLNESSQVNLGPFKTRFRSYYGHIHHNMSDDDIQKFLAQPHVAKMPLNRQVDAFADFLVSQGLADVVAEMREPAKPEDVDPKELAVGKEVEMEHTTDEKEAERIALQHLAEDPEYYKKLRDGGLIDEPEALQKAKELEEMAETDIHFKAVMALWDKSDAQGRRRILDAVGYGATNRDTLKKALRDMDYEDILDVEKALGLEEPIEDSLKIEENSKYEAAIENMLEWMPDDREATDRYYEILDDMVGAMQLDRMSSFLTVNSDKEELKKILGQKPDFKLLAKKAIEMDWRW
jgi:hypothetical protein